MADLKGLKIRLQPNETHLATFRALGANPVAMDVKELYSALEQRVVDGQENPYTVIGASRYSEVQKHLSNSGHFFDFIAVVAKQARLRAAQARVPEGGARGDDRDDRLPAQAGGRGGGEALAELKGKMTYTEIAPAAREEMRKASAAGHRGGEEARRRRPGRRRCSPRPRKR